MTAECTITLFSSAKDLDRNHLDLLFHAQQDLLLKHGGDLSLWKGMRFAFAYEPHSGPVAVVAYDPEYDADKSIWIQLAYVYEHHRGVGLFRKMLDVIREGRPDAKVGIASRSDNETAIRAWKRAGFSEQVRYFWING